LDADRLLPTFKLSIRDATGILGEIAPYDKNLNMITIDFSRSQNPDNLNTFNLVVKRRKPTSERRYEIEGVLDVPDILTSIKKRALTGNIKANLELIANDDLSISNTEIGTSLNYDKTIIQPKWTDAKLLGYLIENLVGKLGEGGYYCFIKNEYGKQIFVFKSLDEILSAPVKYKFIIGHKQYEDFYPVNDYRIYDNSQLIVDLGAKSQKYGYFDYDTGAYVNESIDIEDCPVLSEHFLVDDDNTNDSIFFFKLGRSNDFTSNFDGKMRGSYYKRINNFVNMWIATWGLENISPGDIIKVMFSESLIRGKLFLYQHSGYWMVQRVVHILGNSYMTNLLLTRSGIDTDIGNELMRTVNVKRR